MGLKLFISLLIVAISSYAQELTEDGCYYEYLNTRIMCLEPWETCKDIQNCAECMAICTQFAGICQSVVYRQSTKECFIYRQAVRPSYGRKKRMAGCYGNMPPSLNKNSPDYTYYIVSNSSTCNSGGVVTQAPPPVTYPVTQAPPPPPPVTTQAPPPPPITTQAPPPPPPSTMAPVISDTPPTNPPLPPQATCPTGQSAILVEQKGIQLSGNPDSQFQATSEDACTQACIANQQPTGVFAPCQTADFNTATQQCSFFLNAASPLGTGTTTPNPQFNHYEKNCMDTAVVQQCPGPILKVPQKLLVGYAESVITATSETDCYTQCFNAQTRFGFQCRSGMFYTTDSTNNCILNSESATTQPALFTDESTDKVNYFEPLCMGGGSHILLDLKAKAKAPPKATPKPTPKPTKKPSRLRRDTGDIKPPRKHIIIWPNLADWGSWTRCDGDAKVRYHYRNCKSFNPNKCEVANESCDPTNRAKELQDIADEETGKNNNGNSITLSPPGTTGGFDNRDNRDNRDFDKKEHSRRDKNCKDQRC